MEVSKPWKSLALSVVVSTVAILGVLPNSVLSGTVPMSTANSLIWGPGLKASFNVPARYFFIQAVDTQGNNITHSLGETAFAVSISLQDGGRVRAWIQLLDRHDGSYILRYKLFTSYKDVEISVRYNGKHVAKSPYMLNGDLYHEKCDCPATSYDQWRRDMECPVSYPQIQRDLAPFPEIDMRAVVEDAVARFNQRGAHSLCHYVVKDNTIYRRTFGQHVGFKMFMDAILLSMARKTHLPDMEFIVNLGDWPLAKKSPRDNPIPVLSWCGSDDTLDIVMPTYDITESTLQTMGRCNKTTESLEMPTYEVSEERLKTSCRVSLDLTSVQANTGPAWANKTARAFWRGRDSSRERLTLVAMSKENPHLIDAKLTNMFFFKKDPEKYGEIVKHVSFFEFFKYKYQINMDGTVAAYRFPYLLAGDSLVLKQESTYYEHFYKDLQPDVHYVPLKRDISDLKEKLEWAQKHPEQAQRIAKAGQQYARDNLLAQDIFCYHAVLFKEYAQRLKYPPEVLSDMELVVQPEDRDSECACHAAQSSSRDEL